MTVLLDNGHGEETNGKRSPVWADGSVLYEWEYTRRVVEGIASQLKDVEGIRCITLVPEKSDITLRERCHRANGLASRHGVGKTLLVSVHCNAFTDPSVNGWQIHTYTGRSESDTYAKLFWDVARGILVPKGYRVRRGGTEHDPDYDSNFAMLRDTICPAVLTENLFMTNERDCRYLLSHEGFNDIVSIHAESILHVSRLLL